jgi:hypothetical protein
MAALGNRPSQDRWTHWLYRNVPFWTACESTREGLHGHGVRNVTIIRYGVATQALAVLDSKPLMQPLRLAVAARLAPNKRVDHCLQTLAALRGRGVAACMTIVGGGEMGAALRQEAAQLQLGDSVRFTGLISEQEKDTILRDSHLLLHTSVREGWGLNVIEANAMGTPAAVYPVAGLRESTLHDQTGLVAAEETPASLADQIAGLLGDDARYRRYRHGAWERAKTCTGTHPAGGERVVRGAGARRKSRAAGDSLMRARRSGSRTLHPLAPVIQNVLQGLLKRNGRRPAGGGVDFRRAAVKIRLVRRAEPGRVFANLDVAHR